MSKRRDTTLRDPPCEEQPVNGRPLMIGRGRRLTARGQVRSSGIANESITLGHMAGGLRDMMFGSGYDGEAFYDGTATVQGVAPSGSVYTLTRDIVCTRIVVASGVTVRTAGYTIKCRDLVLRGSAIIHRDGNNGIAATSVTGATKPGAPSNAIVGGGGDGADGANGGATASQGGFSVGSAGSSATGVSYGGGGGAGANGDSVGGGGGAGSGSAGGSVSASVTASTTSLSNIDRLHAGLSFICGGAGGGGGGGGGATAAGDDGGGGGSGGSGGGVLLILAETITLEAWTGRISANGGAGGAGFDATLGGDGGSGGGGGGGFVQVVYFTVSGGTLIASPETRNGSTVSGANVTAAGGAGGTGTGSVNAGTAGTNGYVVLFCVATPFVPASEIPPLSAPVPPPQRKRLHAGHIQATRTRYPLE